MTVEVISKINGVIIMFEFDVLFKTTTSLKPTEFTKNYMQTLTDTASEHFGGQMVDAMIEKIQEDLRGYPPDTLWEEDT